MHLSGLSGPPWAPGSAKTDDPTHQYQDGSNLGQIRDLGTGLAGCTNIFIIYLESPVSPSVFCCRIRASRMNTVWRQKKRVRRPSRGRCNVHTFHVSRLRQGQRKGGAATQGIRPSARLGARHHQVPHLAPPRAKRGPERHFALVPRLRTWHVGRTEHTRPGTQRMSAGFPRSCFG